MRACAFLLLLFLATAELFARVGGGESYSGGSSSSSSSSSYSGGSSGGSSSSSSSGGSSTSGSPALVAFAFLFIIAFAVIKPKLEAAQTVFFARAETLLHSPLTQIRTFDPNFSQVVFEDFCYSLFAHVHHARGAGDLQRYAPYVARDALRIIGERNPAGLKEVRGIIVGAIEVGMVSIGERITVPMTYDANLTEVVDGGEQTFYVRETWTFERARDVLSPPPAKSKADHCPRCGAALQTRTDGACEFCGVKVTDGSFQWFVTGTSVRKKESRGPLLTSNVPEQGTDTATKFQANYDQALAELQRKHPSFKMDDFIARVRHVAVELQEAWTGRDWERVRPLETETLFQMHRYWIDAYLRQDLRNIVADYEITLIQPVKIEWDAFYDAITVRIFAGGFDHTVDAAGDLVAGSVTSVRRWSEYWTFIRTRGTEADPSANVSCPNCGATVAVGATGICSFCRGKLTGGDFGWILSRIEQDEAYTG